MADWGGLVIRPSMTSSYPDCNLRGLVRAFPHVFNAMGFRLGTTTQSIAAFVGTGVHSGVAHALATKLNTGELASEGESEDAALSSFHHEMDQAGDVGTDTTTPTINVAEGQVRRMVKSYLVHIAPSINPMLVETKLHSDAGDGFFVDGTADLMVMEPGGIDDLKTGAVERVALVQVGTYSRIHRAHGYDVQWLRQTFVERVPLAAVQPFPVQRYYDVGLAEQVSEARINQIKRDVIALIETENPLVVQANPSSMLCSAKWCPLHGTIGCRQHKGAK